MFEKVSEIIRVFNDLIILNLIQYKMPILKILEVYALIHNTFEQYD